MSTKIQPISGMEDTIQTAITVTTSVSSTVSPKVSLFAKKAGFVIPKNKLSGSLVPIFRGSKNPDGTDGENKESTKQVLRKTKWGPDLTQDSFVRKGRATAYQTRLEQITQQLNSKLMEAKDDQDSKNHQSIEDSELLELERREVIGEILKLNPSYKAPADYKPLLKEAKVTIPIKEYPERNFIGLLFGPACDTPKRLEKETGAKIRVYGTKKDAKKESEITSYDENEDYEEVFVVVTAETYDKVDVAVSLIELLVTPVLANPVPVPTENPVSEDNPTTVHLTLTQDPPVVSLTQDPQGVAQPSLGQFRPHPNPWLPPGQSLRFTTPPFPNLSLSTPPFPNLPVSIPPNSSQPPGPPLHRPSMGYVGPPRNHLPPVQGAPGQQSFTAPPFTPSGGPPIPRPGWSQPPQMVRPQPPVSQFRPVAPPPPPPVLPPPAIRPQPPSSNDFTFQTHRPQTQTQIPRPGSQSHQFMPPPQPPLFRAAPPPQPPMMQGFHSNHQMGPSNMPPARPIFSGHGLRPPPTMGGPRGNFRQNRPPPMGFRPHNFGNVPYFAGRPPANTQLRPPQQVYDPFSPSAVPPPHKPGNPQNSKKQESDPEYDDLMASVGVK